MKDKPVAIIITLLGGAIAAICCLVNGADLFTALITVFITLLVFMVIGLIASNNVTKIKKELKEAEFELISRLDRERREAMLEAEEREEQERLEREKEMKRRADEERNERIRKRHEEELRAKQAAGDDDEEDSFSWVRKQHDDTAAEGQEEANSNGG